MDTINELLVTETALSDSVIYNQFNANAEMTQLIVSAIKDSIVIDSSYIQEQLMQIQRTKISPLADKVLQAYENGDITLLYAKVKKVPQALPFFATKMNGKVKVFIFVNNYGTISKVTTGTGEKYLNMTMKDLYVLMEGAYTAYHYAVYPVRITKSLGLMKVCCSVYTSLLMRILNKEYSIGMDEDLYAKVVYSIGRFFLETVWGSTNKDVNFSYACSNIKNVVNTANMLPVAEDYDAHHIKTLNDLIAFMKEFSPRLKTINLRYVLQCYINTYKAGAIFSLECLPYFLYTVECAMIGSFLVNQPMIVDVTKTVKGMNTFYPELVKAIS